METLFKLTNNGTSSNWQNPINSLKLEKEKIKEKDIESALNADFENSTPNLKTMKLRTQYNENLDFHCIPRGQRYIIFYTFGPDDKYDIKITHDIRGIRFFGVLPDLHKVKNHLELIRQKAHNAYGVFINFHVIDVLAGNGIIQIPPPNDGSSETHFLNKMHGEIMKQYLNKIYEEAEYVNWKKDDALQSNKIVIQNVKKFNHQINECLNEIVNNDTPKELIENVLLDIALYEKNENVLSTPGGATLEKQIECLDTVHPRLVKQYLIVLQSSFDVQQFPSNYKIYYTKFLTSSQKWCIIRIIDKFNENEKIRVSEEALFIVDFSNTKFNIDSQSTIDKSQEKIEEKIKEIHNDNNNNNNNNIKIENEPQKPNVLKENIFPTLKDYQTHINTKRKEKGLVPLYDIKENENENENIISLNINQSIDNLEKQIKEINKKHPWFFSTAFQILLYSKH